MWQSCEVEVWAPGGELLLAIWMETDQSAEHADFIEGRMIDNMGQIFSAHDDWLSQ